ncbi:MAG: GNAT family N-acetyltransferase [Spirochaetales bacterium]|nr:GNAT family N-acetyltransferase [Spirochaetales bacterium]
MEIKIRKTIPADEAAVGEVCFATFRDGRDERFHRLAGLRWAIPYLRYEAENCFVAVDEKDQPVGYILSALDSKAFKAAFHKRMRGEIKEELKKRRSEFTCRAYLKESFHKLHYLENLPGWISREYPAHLHIDIHPKYQGMGLGGKMMGEMLGHLKGAECPGVHLGVGTENKGAIRFYERSGFQTLKVSRRHPVTFMGLIFK